LPAPASFIADVGCGSLRIGRLLIPYLNLGKYFGVEPNKWLVQEGINREVGETLVQSNAQHFSSPIHPTQLRRRTFHSICHGSINLQSLWAGSDQGLVSAISRSLAEDGALVATFLPGDEDSFRTGWSIPNV